MTIITCERCGKQEERATKARFCLQCSNERGKTYYAAHRKEMNDRGKAYYADHHKEILARIRRQRAKNKHKMARRRKRLNCIMKLTNQWLANSMNANQTNANLAGSQYNAQIGNNLQTIMSNTQNTNQMNAQTELQAYTNLTNQYNTGINVAQQNFNNANTAVNSLANMYNQQGQWDSYGLNAQRDIWNQRAQNALGFGNQYVSALNSIISNAATPITITQAAQNALLGTPTALLNQSLNMTQPAQQLIAGTANQGTTTQTQSSGGDFMSGLLGAVSVATPFLLPGAGGTAASTVVG